MILKPTDFKNDQILFHLSVQVDFLYPDQDVLTATLAPTVIVQSDWEIIT